MRFRSTIAMAMCSAALSVADPGYSIRLGANLTKHLLVPELASGNRMYGRGLHVSATREAPWRFGALTIGAGYEQRNGSYETEEVSDDGSRFMGESATSLAYLIVPAGIQFEDRSIPRGRPYLALRLVPSLLFQAREEGMIRGWDENGDLVLSRDFSENAMNNTTQWDVVAEAELGWSMPLGFPRPGGGARALLGAGIGYGLVDNYDPLNDPVPEEEYSYHSLIVRLFAGIGF